MKYIQKPRSAILALLLCLFAGVGATAAVRAAQTAPAAPTAPSAGPPTRPILRIETGMHTAAIRAVGIDRAGRFLVTGSNDKTVRVWSLADGALLRTLRPPIGDGYDGQIYGVAISPDGSTIACAGWTGYGWDGSDSVYLFDRESGALERCITGLPNIIINLAFSPDGRYLAAGLGGNGGVRVFTAADGRPVMEDKDYTAGICGTDWDANGRFVASSYDGFVRLYGPAPELKLIAKVKAPGGNRPEGIRFSPDGSRIAVGYNDSNVVSVLSGNGLDSLYTPDTTGITPTMEVSRVAWSSDGETLYAGGDAYDPSGHDFIRAWSNAGRGAFHDTPVSHDLIFDLCPLPPGSAGAAGAGALVYASGEPTWGMLDATGQRLSIGKTSPIADFRANGNGFQLAEDGSSVAYGFEPFGKEPARLVVPDRALTVVSAGDTAAAQIGMAGPTIQAAGINVADWQDTPRPTLNGQPLPLVPDERSRSFAITPDHQAFLLGTEWYLRCFGADGKQKWIVPAPGVVWAVNVAHNGSVGVAACADGTIRWYRMRDGKELLAFFPHADKKRWVLWTPDGYYDCSPGGEDLIGWHINRGKDQAADFFPASRFRGLFYRPDVIQLILTTLDGGEALRLANQAAARTPAVAAIGGSGAANAPVASSAITALLPPVVSIVSPSDLAPAAAGTVTIRFTVRTPADAPATNVRALVDGRPPDGARGLDLSSAAAVQTTTTAADGSEVRELTVAIPARDCEVSILAENKNAISSPASVRIKWEQPVQPDTSPLKPKLYVLAIGVGKYALPGHDLTFPAKDATDFAAAIQTQSGGLYREVESKVITDEQATKDNVLDGLEWIQRQTTSRDVAMVFLSGHGDNDPDGNYYFLTHDFDGQRWKRTAVSYSDIQSTLRDIKGKALFFVDTCHSGGVDGNGTRRKGGNVDINLLVNDLSSAENGVVVFTASTGRQSALENDSWGNGAFTLALLEAITGKNRGTVPPGHDAEAVMTLIHQTGKATITSLDAYLAERVKQLTGGTQTPTTTKPETVPDFPVASVGR